MGGHRISNLRCAYDVDLLVTNTDWLQSNLEKVNKTAEIMVLEINVILTKSVLFGREKIEQRLQLVHTEVENVEEFAYLESLITWDNDCCKKIKSRIELWQNCVRRGMWKKSAWRLLNACVFSVLLYACETWTIKRNTLRSDKSLANEMLQHITEK